MKTTTQEAPAVGDVRTQSSAVAKAEPRTQQLPAVRTDADGNISPTQLIALAIEREISPESLEKLVDLQHRMEERNAAKLFIRDLAALKAELPTIKHTKKAAFTAGGGKVSYSYTEMDELAAALQPFLGKYGFTTGWDQKFDGKLVTTICTLQHIEGHSRSSSFTLPSENNSAASPQQKIGMADTYAGRRAFLAVLGLTTSDAEPLAREMDPTPVSEDEATELSDLIAEVHANKAKFLEHFDVDAISKLPKVRYAEAKTLLAQVAARRKQEANPK